MNFKPVRFKGQLSGCHAVRRRSAWSRVVLTAVAGVLVRRGIFWRERRDIHWGSPVLAQAETGERQPQARGP